MARVKQPGGLIESYGAEVKEKAFQMYRRGKTALEIGTALGVSPTTIATWSSRGKWKHRAKGLVKPNLEAEAEAAKREATPLFKSELDASAMSFEEKQSTYKERMARQAVRVAEYIEQMPAEMLIGAAEKVEKLDKLARKALNLETASPSIIVNVGLLSAGTGSEKRAIARTLPASGPPRLVADTGSKPAPGQSEEVAPVTGGPPAPFSQDALPQ